MKGFFSFSSCTKVLLGTALVLGFAPNASAQPWQWAVKTGQTTVSETEPRLTAVTPTGNVLVAGEFDGTVAFGPTTFNAVAGSDDIFLAQYTSAGVVQWAVQLGGSDEEHAQGLTTDGAGNIYLGLAFEGDTITIGGTTFVNQGPGSGGGSSDSYDAVVVKLNATGQVQWAHHLASAESDELAGIVADAAGNVYVAGRRILDSSSNPPAGGYPGDAVVTKLSGTGAVLWTATGGSYEPSYSGPYGVAIGGASGRIFITGAFTDSARFGTTRLVAPNSILSGLGDDDAFVAALDGATGQWLWATRAGGDLPDLGTAITTDSVGNVLMTGVYASPLLTIGTDTLEHGDLDLLSFNAFVARLDSAGNWIWATRASGPADVWTSAIVAGPSGDAYVVGAFADSARIGTTTLVASIPGEFSGFLARFDQATGTAWWAQFVDGHAEDPVSAVPALARDAAGDLYLAGRYDNQATFGAFTLNSPLSQVDDGYLARFTDVLPMLMVVSPGVSPVGSTVTLTGQRFSGTTQVLFNGVPATFTVVSPTQITVTVPIGATSGLITVTTPAGTVSSAVVFRVGPTGLTEAGVRAFALYPNPARGTAQLMLAAPGAAGVVTVLDGLGRVVRTQPVAAGQTEVRLTLGGLPAGVYTVRVGQAARKLVVE